MGSFAAQLVLVLVTGSLPAPRGALAAHTQHLHRVALRKGSEDAEGRHCGLFSGWERQMELETTAVACGGDVRAAV